ncbi:baseplate wedge protein 53 [bacterium]|jgi:hypothetical protein|nr:baseplate wedge protein 53 [bacterium]
MAYFSQFPTIRYDLEANGNTKLVPDIFRKVVLKNKYKDNYVLLDSYDVEPGEKPEDVAFKVYGDATLHWLILSINKMSNRYHDWPKSYQAFEEYVNDKYAEPNGIHHYEKSQSSGKTSSQGPSDFDYLVEVDSSDVDGQSVSNYEYEQRLEDQKRQIKLLSPQYLSTFMNEFRKLIRR